MLLTANASPIYNSLELVRMELYLRGLRMATKWSKDMMRSTEHSMSVNLWIKNSWTKQASAEIPVALNKILSMVGREEKDKPRSEMASMERK